MTESESKTETRDWSKYCHLPISHPKLIKHYDTLRMTFWVPEEIHLGDKDRSEWNALDPNTRNFLEGWLAFFSQFDGLVMENLEMNFQGETSFLKEARAFYALQNANEQIHNHTYSLMIETFIRDDEKKAMMFNAIENDPILEEIANWVIRWMNKSIPFSERLIVFACLEGILFSGAFAAIYWIKQRNILKGLTKANEWIARDEGVHVLWGVDLYSVVVDELKKFKPANVERSTLIIKECVDLASKLIRSTLDVDLIGMNSDDMIKYIKCTAGAVSRSFGFPDVYETTNPFDWMVVIGLPNKTNFFEDTSISEYSKESGDQEFDIGADF